MQPNERLSNSQQSIDIKCMMPIYYADNNIYVLEFLNNMQAKFYETLANIMNL